MFRFPIAAVVGLTTALTAASIAQADTIIYQGTPTFEPLVITRGEATVLPGATHDILQDPAFHRLAQMCETMGLACGPDEITAQGGIAPVWSPGHMADAEKRLAQLLEDRDAAQTLPGILPPRIPPRLFGWNTPFSGHVWPRPHGITPPLAHLYPAQPSTVLPNLPRPHHDLSGFFHRLNTPAAMPHTILPRPTFPWRTF
ncbi:hypothetical protein [Gymnodinialimonas sp.]